MDLYTPRLHLRCLEKTDLPALSTLCADPMVMRYFPKPLNDQESEAFASKIRTLYQKQGWGICAVEKRDNGEFIGIVGLIQSTGQGFPLGHPFVEMTWRIRSEYWRQGFAFEAASACLDYGFTQLNLDALYAFTAKINGPSICVMEKLKMHNTHLDFDHPRLDPTSPLLRHCLYRLRFEEWQSKQPK